MANDIEQNTSPVQSYKIKLEKAFDRLEKAIDDKIAPVAKSQEVDVNVKLMAAHQDITELRKKNKLASDRLDSTIAHIRKILGN